MYLRLSFDRPLMYPIPGSAVDLRTHRPWKVPGVLVTVGNAGAARRRDRGVMAALRMILLAYLGSKPPLTVLINAGTETGR